MNLYLSELSRFMFLNFDEIPSTHPSAILQSTSTVLLLVSILLQQHDKIVRCDDALDEQKKNRTAVSMKKYQYRYYKQFKFSDRWVAEVRKYCTARKGLHKLTDCSLPASTRYDTM